MNELSRLTAGTLATLLLAACATAPLPEYSRKHPANPDAAQAPAPAVSGALEAYRGAAARTGSPAAATAHENIPAPANDDQPAEHRHEH